MPSLYIQTTLLSVSRSYCQQLQLSLALPLARVLPEKLRDQINPYAFLTFARYLPGDRSKWRFASSSIATVFRSFA
jgi:hypothetical protein